MEKIITHEQDGKFFTPLDPSRLFSRKRDAEGHHVTLTLKKESSSQFRDRRNLDELITIWYRMHGKTLRDHVRLRKLLYRVSERLGNPIGSELTNEQFALYREQRTTEVSTSTINREHAYLRAMFNELDRLGVIAFENPLIKIRKFKEREGELRYLTHDEIDTLLHACRVSTNRSLLHIVKICLATGARWSEAEKLKPTQIQNNQITFLNTKSGKNRTIPISNQLFDELTSIKPVSDARIFLSSSSAFRIAVSKSQIQLPRGQMSHVLRHSFASHFVMKGGNIVVLRDILGHSEITTTMRYAHLAPNHLTDAVRLNPLNDH
ncbi:phage integrase [Aliivibrio finisterrensis]|uniref:Site-specific integrase n=1 Tax=Aliivibrio finisterrensis TaxID=511998 RepID=A0ABY0I5Y9_9GAMM|nr:tyrosine-type recombinase/integrase [Aliivibrio finisterrensis]RYU62164.1 site-specific integrase [Aliivibrio finisterrensis]RYU79838.1 site-specific integrase [Aliivibrio finisterrensis]